MSAHAAERGCGRSRAIAASSVPTARCPVLPCRPSAPAKRAPHLAVRDETSWLAARGPWLLWALDFNLSIAAAVGFIALAGVAAETGGELRAKCSAAYRPFTRADLNVAIVRRRVDRVRPKSDGAQFSQSMVLALISVGRVKPSFARAERLTLNVNWVAPAIGRSAGLAPCRILSTYLAAS
jgi:hypothetical protein